MTLKKAILSLWLNKVIQIQVYALQKSNSNYMTQQKEYVYVPQNDSSPLNQELITHTIEYQVNQSKIYDAEQIQIQNIPQQQQNQLQKQLYKQQLTQTLQESIYLKENRKDKNFQSSDDELQIEQTTIKSKKYHHENIQDHMKHPQLQNLIQYFRFFYKSLENQTYSNQQKISQNIKQILSTLQDPSIICFSQGQQLQYQYKISQKIGEIHQIMLNNFIEQIISKPQSQFQFSGHYAQKPKLKFCYQSQNSEIIILEVHYSHFKTQIKILNQLEESPLHTDVKVMNFGAFGNVFLVSFDQLDYSIKCIPLTKKQTRQKQIIFDSIQLFQAAIIEYFFIKLFSQMKIGPKVKKMFGFDMIVRKNCIQFSTQVCEQIKIQEQQYQILKQDLIMMHLLKIVHRDIKSFNIMYSPTFKKIVFIDFGGSKFLSECIGQKSLSKFYGTAGFCTQQVFRLIDLSRGYVNLYLNDVYGLKKTFDSRGLICNQQKVQNTKSYNCRKIQNAWLFIYKMKYCMLNQQWNQYFQNLYRIKSQNLQFSEDHQINLLQFFIEFQATRSLVQNLEELLSQINSKTLYIYSILRKIKKQAQKKISLLKINDYKQKQRKFRKVDVFYKAIKIIHSQISQKQKDMEFILLWDNTSLLKYITDKEIHINLSYQSPEIVYFDINFFCYIILSYCTFSNNIYKNKIQEKIKAAEVALQRIRYERGYNVQKQLELCFYCPFQYLTSLAVFFQYVTFHMWRQFPLNLKHSSEKMLISSLCLLGYPTTNPFAKIYLSDNFLKCEQSRIQKILFFSRIFLITASYGFVFYDRDIKHFYKKFTNEELKTMRLKQAEIMKNPKYQKSFYTLNNSIFIKVVENTRIFNAESFQQVYKIIMESSYEKIEQKQEIREDQFNMWKYLSLLHLAVVTSSQGVESAQDYNNLVNTINKNEHHKNNQGLPLLNPTYIVEAFYLFQNEQNKQFIQFFDNIINEESLSVYFRLDYRLILAFKQNNCNKVQNIVHLVVNELKSECLWNIEYINYCLRSFTQFFIQLYNQNTIVLNKQNVKIYFSSYSKLIKKAFQLALFSQNNYLNNNKIFPKIQSVVQYRQLSLEKTKNQRQSQDYRYIINNLIIMIQNSTKAYFYLEEKLQQKNNNLIFYNFKNDTERDFSSQLILKNKKKMQKDQQSQILQLSQKQIKQFIDRIRGKNDLKKYLLNNHQSKNKYVFQVLNSSDFYSTKHSKLKLFIQQIYGQFTMKDILLNGFDNYPLIEVIKWYFLAKVDLSNHSNLQYENLLHFYQHCGTKPFTTLHKISTEIRYIFVGFVYLQKPLQTFRKFFLSLSQQIKKNLNKNYIQSFYKIFQQFLIIYSQYAFPKPVVYWNPALLMEYLAQHIYLHKYRQNSYMSLVYFYGLRNLYVSLKSRQILLRTTLKQLPYINSKGRQIILNNLFQIVQRIQYEKIKKNQKNQQQKWISRKIYLQRKHLRNRMQFYDCQLLIEKHFNIKNIISPYYWNKKPQVIKQAYKRKLFSYYQVKINKFLYE